MKKNKKCKSSVTVKNIEKSLTSPFPHKPRKKPPIFINNEVRKIIKKREEKVRNYKDIPNEISTLNMVLKPTLSILNDDKRMSIVPNGENIYIFSDFEKKVKEFLNELIRVSATEKIESSIFSEEINRNRDNFVQDIISKCTNKIIECMKDVKMDKTQKIGGDIKKHLCTRFSEYVGKRDMIGKMSEKEKESLIDILDE